MTKKRIKELCEQYGFLNFTVNDDMTVDVNGNVGPRSGIFTELPVAFGKVTGYFDCSGSKLTTLKGCPYYVSGNFSCNDNPLTTLEYCPKHVSGRFMCNISCITTLQHLPVNFYVGGSFYCYDNGIKDVNEYGKLFFGYIGGEIVTKFGENSKYTILDTFLNENKNPPKKYLPKLLSELRKIKL